MTLSLEPLNKDSFGEQTGSSFAVLSAEDGDTISSLELAEVSGTQPRPFSLIFQGSSMEPLSQDTYWLGHPELGKQWIFLVPLSDDGKTRRYQAVFN